MIHDFFSTKKPFFIRGWGKRVPRCMGAALVGAGLGGLEGTVDVGGLYVRVFWTLCCW